MSPSDSSSSGDPLPAIASMVELLAQLCPADGTVVSKLPGVKFMRSARHIPPTPVVYEPSIVIVAQGSKIGTVGGQRFVYDAGNYLSLTVPLPFECETFGEPQTPLLALSIGVTPTVVTELLLEMQPSSRQPDLHPKAIEAIPLDEDIACAAVRLLECLQSDERARILGPGIVREIIYFALQGVASDHLRALAVAHSQFGNIVRVLNRIHTHYAQPNSIEALARAAGMSVSAFHTRFKSITALSPLQYLKAIRLHKARLLMVNAGSSAAEAADSVGYESRSQFSREFKRFFGESPSTEVARLRASFSSEPKSLPAMPTSAA